MKIGFASIEFNMLAYEKLEVKEADLEVDFSECKKTVTVDAFFKEMEDRNNKRMMQQQMQNQHFHQQMNRRY